MAPARPVARCWRGGRSGSPPPPMTVSPTLAQARAAWLSGDGAAWSRYTACLRDLAATDGPPPHPRDGRERTARRARRRGRVARA